MIAYTTNKFFIEALDKSTGTNDLVRKLVNTLRDAGIRQIRQYSAETERKKKVVVKQKPEKM